MSRYLTALAALAVVAVAVSMLLSPGGGPGLAPQVAANLGASGVASPVTAVLLNFRSLDTLLEVVVLAAAAIGVTGLAPGDTRLSAAPPRSALTAWLIPRLAPLAWLFAAYLWWAGSTRPGGAFQAGAVLAGALLLLALFGHGGRFDPQRPLVLALALAGPLLFLLVGTLPLAAGYAFLQYPAGWSTPLILLVEALLTFAIGAGLALLTGGGRPAR